MMIRADLVRATQARWAKIEKAATAARAGDGPRAVSARGRQSRLGALVAQGADPLAARAQLERVIAGNDLTGINYLALGTARARSVCRVRLRAPSGATVGFGTGFLVAPGVLMTNHHVISRRDEA